MLTLTNLFVAVCLFIPTATQVVQPGRCPRVRSQPRFNINRYLGIWFESEKYFFIQEVGLKCNAAVYSFNMNGTLNIFNAGIDIRNGMIQSASAVGYQENPFEPGRLTVQFPGVMPGPYIVLATDYNRFSLVYSCRNENGQKAENVFILTRHRYGLTPDIRAHLYRILDSYGINPRFLERTDQSFCPRIPIPQNRPMGGPVNLPMMQRPTVIVHPPMVEIMTQF